MTSVVADHLYWIWYCEDPRRGEMFFQECLHFGVMRNQRRRVAYQRAV